MTDNERSIKAPKAPPLGLVRREAWEASMRQQRVKLISEAMLRFSQADRVIPEEWVRELHELLGDTPEVE